MGIELDPGALLFNKYRIENIVGRGGLGAVYKATDIRLERTVAIKTLMYGQATIDHRYGSGTFDEFLQRFEREAKVSSYFTENPRIVTVYGLEQDDESNYYLILEYLESSLVELMKKESHLSVEKACNIALDICNALADIHNHPVDLIHRDLKPGNILLRANGRAVVADFGIAQVGHESHRTVVAGQRHPGTPAYASPEQMSGYHYLTPASDLYSLGLILYEMLTGKLFAKFKRMPPSVENDQIPRWLDEVVVKLLQKEPDDRYQQAEEVAAAIQAGLSRPVFNQKATIEIYRPDSPPQGNGKTGHQDVDESHAARQQQAEAVLQAQVQQELEAERRRREAEAALTAQLQREAELERSLGIDPLRSIEDLEAQFVVAMYLSDWDEVINLGEHILAQNPMRQPTRAKTAAAYKSRGVSFHIKGEYDRAIEDFRRAIKLDPTKADYYYERGSTYRSQHFYTGRGNYDRAIDDFSRAIKLDANKADYFWQRGSAYHIKGDFDRAIDDFNQAIRLNPNRADYYWERGGSHHSKGEYKKALDDYNRAIKLEPGIAQYYFSRGLTHKARGDKKGAKRDFELSAELGFTKAHKELLGL